MGSRRGPSAQQILGSGASSARNQTQLQKKLRDASSRAVAEAAFQAVAQSNPTIATLYLAYRAAKFTYPIVKKGVEEYRKSGDKEKAIDKMKEETVKQVGREMAGAAVDVIVGNSVDAVKDTAKITLDKPVDTFVREAISGTISEMIG
jgi:hypothetical protein